MEALRRFEKTGIVRASRSLMPGTSSSVSSPAATLPWLFSMHFRSVHRGRGLSGTPAALLRRSRIESTSS